MSGDNFLDRANSICNVLKKETGLNYYVERVNKKELFDIMLDNKHIEQLSDYQYLIGYLTGIIITYRKIDCDLKIQLNLKKLVCADGK